MNLVVVDIYEKTLPLAQAVAMGITPTVAFKKKNGWILGAPQHLANVAFRMFKGEWVEFSRRNGSPTGRIRWQPISEY